MRLIRAAGVMVVAGVLGGCLDAHDSDEPRTTSQADTWDPNDSAARDTWDPNDSAADTASPSDTTRPLDPDVPSGPVVEADPSAWTGPWCMPSPADLQPSVTFTMPPPEALVPECRLTFEGTTSAGGVQHGTRYRRDGDVLWVTWQSGYDPVLGRFTLDEANRVREVRVGDPIGGVDGPFFGALVYVYTLDEGGHLTRFAREDRGQQTTLATQTWDGERLLARHTHTEVTATVAVDGDTTYTWDEAGRFVGARATLGDHRWSVAWSYDDAGRPSHVERSHDELVYQSISWTFADDGALLRRDLSWSPTPGGTLRLAGDDYDRTLPAPGLDVQGAEVYPDYQSNPWSGSAGSVPRARDGLACAELPATVDYGFPDEEVEYELAMPTAERPNGIGFAYGADTYGWSYGDHSWYSHAGVAGFDNGLASWDSHVESRIDYRGGRMQKEQLVADGGTHIAWQRERTFEADVITEDRVDVTVGPWDYDSDPSLDTTPRTYGRTLLFTRDAHGGLAERELVDDTRGLIERQTWTRDATRRWLDHTVLRTSFSARINMWPGGESSACSESLPCDAPRVWARYAHELDPQGREIVFREQHPYGQDTPEAAWTELHTTWDDDGHMLTREQVYLRETWEYDALGRVTVETQDYGLDGTTDYRKEWSYDAAGRWLSKLSYDASGAALGGELRTFSCGSVD